LLLLGLLTTTVGHLLMMKSLRFFTAGEVGLLISGQPVSAIIIAFFLLGEVPENNVVIGAAIILIAVFISFRQIQKEKSA
jgi:drug/metabolite transporter (DMT)-like permease